MMARCEQCRWPSDAPSHSRPYGQKKEHQTGSANGGLVSYTTHEFVTPSPREDWKRGAERDVNEAERHGVEEGMTQAWPTPSRGAEADEAAARELARKILGVAFEAQGWQPIETAPRDGTLILAHDRGPWPYIVEWHQHTRSWIGADGRCWTPHRWQPLPAPPSPHAERPGPAQPGREESNRLSAHTPTPWQAPSDVPEGIFSADADQLLIATTTYTPHDLGVRAANAAFIVLAVNNHDRLVKALEEAEIQLAYLDMKYPTGTTPPVLARVRAALSPATQEQK